MTSRSSTPGPTSRTRACARRSSTTADGGLQLDTPQFAWELNKLTNVKQ